MLKIPCRHVVVRAWPCSLTSRRLAEQLQPGQPGLYAKLMEELHALKASSVVLATALPASRSELSTGISPNSSYPGWPCTTFAPEHPAVILEANVEGEVLQFLCDRYIHWVANLRAISEALASLRTINQNGVGQGRAYGGFLKYNGYRFSSQPVKIRGKGDSSGVSGMHGGRVIFDDPAADFPIDDFLNGNTRRAHSWEAAGGFDSPADFFEAYRVACAAAEAHRAAAQARHAAGQRPSGQSRPEAPSPPPPPRTRVVDARDCRAPAAFLSQHSGVPEAEILASAQACKAAWRKAARVLHPDAGGKHELFVRLGECYEELKLRHGIG